MYVCIIPGPHQPSTVVLNHYLRPLVDDMFESWTQGIWYSKTALQPQGRVTRSAIVVGAMDLLAAHHLSQLASHSTHIYCTVCQCVHQTTLGRTDVENWLFCDDSITKMHANQWKSARTAQDQENFSGYMGLDTLSCGGWSTGVPLANCQSMLCIAYWKIKVPHTSAFYWGSLQHLQHYAIPSTRCSLTILSRSMMKITRPTG